MVVPVKHTQVYRQVLREISRSSKSSHATHDRTMITSSLRAIIAKERHGDKDRQLFNHDIQNVITFMRARRGYKELIDRYNPLVDLTAEERIHATARRVGLDMPTTHRPGDKE